MRVGGKLAGWLSTCSWRSGGGTRDKISIGETQLAVTERRPHPHISRRKPMPSCVQPARPSVLVLSVSVQNVSVLSVWVLSIWVLSVWLLSVSVQNVSVLRVSVC